MFRANPSPEGRGWCEAPGEGYRMKFLHVVPLTRPFGPPSPFGRGIRRNIAFTVMNSGRSEKTRKSKTSQDAVPRAIRAKARRSFRIGSNLTIAENTA